MEMFRILLSPCVSDKYTQAIMCKIFIHRNYVILKHFLYAIIMMCYIEMTRNLFSSQFLEKSWVLVPKFCSNLSLTCTYKNTLLFLFLIFLYNLIHLIWFQSWSIYVHLWSSFILNAINETPINDTLGTRHPPPPFN